jgi:hypothetical protein
LRRYGVMQRSWVIGLAALTVAVAGCGGSETTPIRTAPPQVRTPGPVDKYKVETVTGNGNVLVLDNGDVYALTSGEASEGAEVTVTKGEKTITDPANGETLEVQRVGNLSESKRYTGASKSTQDTSSKNGAIIVLRDGSVWSIAGGDQAKTRLWEDADSITIHEESGSGYELVNAAKHDQSATAHFVGEG